MDSPPDEADRPKLPIGRRLAPLILVVGAFASAFVLIPRVPRERHVELRLEDAATVVGIHVDWLSSTRGGASAVEANDDPIQGTTWRFSPGEAPRSVTTNVRLLDGAYTLEILVEREGRTDVVHRSLVLGDADQIAVQVR